MLDGSQGGADLVEEFGGGLGVGVFGRELVGQCGGFGPFAGVGEDAGGLEEGGLAVAALGEVLDEERPVLDRGGAGVGELLESLLLGLGVWVRGGLVLGVGEAELLVGFVLDEPCDAEEGLVLSGAAGEGLERLDVLVPGLGVLFIRVQRIPGGEAGVGELGGGGAA